MARKAERSPAGRPRRRTAKRGAGALEAYRRKRDFSGTPEPEPVVASSAGGDSYLIHKHAARRVHYDFRLELDGVLLSWAVPQGPSLDPADRRLAVRTEDHPLEYGRFEGVIPAGEYGGGPVMLWDRGTWTPTKDPRAGLKHGKLEFELEGERLKGAWVLARMRPRADEPGGKENWLLIKRHGEHERPGVGAALVERETTSVASGRTMEEIASDPDRVWSSKKGEPAAPPGNKSEAKKRNPRNPVKLIAAAPKGRLPDFVPPQLATLVGVPPPGDRWVHEIKFDGYRTEARLDKGRVRLLTRSGLDWTRKFAPIAQALATLPVASAMIDGEIVFEDASGVPSFAELQQALSQGKPERLRYFAFDLLHLDGHAVAKLPLVERKAALAELLEGLPDGAPVFYAQHYAARGPEFFRHACRLALEGVVSKRADAPYASGRGRSWLKAKCTHRQEFVVGGWLSSNAAGRDLRSILVGYHDKGKLIYAGKIGTGFNASNSAQLLDALRKSRRKTSPLAAVPKEVAKGVHWVDPRVVIEAEFSTWTRDGVIRHAAFKGVREDKQANEVSREVAIDENPASLGRVAGHGDDYAGVALTHPDRLLWPDDGITKERLADYYASVHDLVLPHIVNRPLSLVRCPDGIQGECFFQRHLGQGLPGAVKAVAVRAEKQPYLAIEDAAGLFSLVQFSTLEIHPWGATAHDPEHPDRIVMDFDPGETVPFSKVVEAAFECRDRLATLRLTSFVKTTGGKGLHVVIPLAGKHGWAEIKAFAQGLASTMAAENRAYVTHMAKSARKGRIFIDTLRNDRAATAIAPYSTRARPGAPIALPLDWDELGSVPSGRHYTVATVARRLRSLGHDPWAEMATTKQRLSAKAKRAVGVKE